VFFPEVGWVRFEPTPSAQTGATPVYANPESNEIPVPQSVIDAAQNGQPAPVPSGAPEQGQGRPEQSDGVDSSQDVPWPLIAGAITVALALLALGLWLMLRRRRERAALGEGPDAAWSWLHGQLPEELAWPLSSTPHEAEDHVVETLAHLGAPLPARAVEAFDAIVNAVSDHRYAPQGTMATEGQLRELAGVVVEAATQALEDATGRPARGGARSALRA
jgi:hypothetical protein